MIHRVHPDMQIAVFDSLEELLTGDADYGDAHVSELDQHTLLRPAIDALGIGAGAPPVATDWGLLLFFHERVANGTYTVNVALLDPPRAACRHGSSSPSCCRSCPGSGSETLTTSCS